MRHVVVPAEGANSLVTCLPSPLAQHMTRIMCGYVGRDNSSKEWYNSTTMDINIWNVR